MTVSVATAQEFEDLAKQLARLALDNDVSKHALLSLLSDEYDKERDARRKSK